MAWVSLLLAGVLEVVWAFAMKQSHGFTRVGPTGLMLVAMVASFGLLSFSMKTLPLGTAYAVWTGIGVVGAFAIGIAAFGERVTLGRALAVALVLAGLAVLKWSEPG